ncbi:MAG: hypothetical protein KKB79_02180 [Nanoarchaeota archaeon]|nr:hypothetical protein [Nanoarchaeota archaeon]
MDLESTSGMYESRILEELESSPSNVDQSKRLEYNIDGCSCMGCGCFKSVWTMVVSPAGIAAGMAAYAADAAL